VITSLSYFSSHYFCERAAQALRGLLFFAILFTPALSWGNEDLVSDQLRYQTTPLTWSLKKHKRDIQIFTAKVPSSKYVAVLSVMTVNASPTSLAALVMDFENCPKWAAMCKKASIQQQISDNELIVYSLNDAPFPVRDRDVMARVSWLFDVESQKISMLSQAINSPLNVKKKVIRVSEAVSEWHFTPQENGQTLVENFAHIDPNGAMPAWIINALIIDSPYKTLKRMRRIVESGEYDDINLPFISTSKSIVDGEMSSK
jgi:hypothetical protein